VDYVTAACLNAKERTMAKALKSERNEILAVSPRAAAGTASLILANMRLLGCFT